MELQEEVGILSSEVKARMAANYANGGTTASAPAAAEAPPPGQTALFNAHDDAVERARRRSRVREVRRPDDPYGQLLHVPRLRHEHRLQLNPTSSCS